MLEQSKQERWIAAPKNLSLASQMIHPAIFGCVCLCLENIQRGVARWHNHSLKPVWLFPFDEEEQQQYFDFLMTGISIQYKKKGLEIFSILVDLIKLHFKLVDSTLF